MQKIIIYTDGGARGNPGPAGVGAAITDEAGKVLHEASKFLGVGTNNEAEYQAGILGFSLLQKSFPAAKLKTLEVVHKLDSELVCKQLRGEYKIKEPRLRALHTELTDLISSLGVSQVTFTHIPRAQNARADKLANEAMDRAG